METAATAKWETSSENLFETQQAPKLKFSRPPWDEYFMAIAEVAKERGTCLVRKCGAVLVKDKRIIATGYNGTPTGISHCVDGACERCAKRTPQTSGVYEDKCICCHAEENVIAQAALHGVSSKGATLYTTFTPCWWCAKLIINAGIERVVAGAIYPGNEVTFRLLGEAGVKLTIFEKKAVVTTPESTWK